MIGGRIVKVSLVPVVVGNDVDGSLVGVRDKVGEELISEDDGDGDRDGNWEGG